MRNWSMWSYSTIIFVLDWPHRPLNSKGFMIYIKICAIVPIRLKLEFRSSNPLFKGCSFISCDSFSLFMVSIWVYIQFKHISLLLLLSFYHLTFLGKSVRLFALHVWNHYSKTLLVQTFKRLLLSDWVGPKWMCLLKVSCLKMRKKWRFTTCIW